MRRGCLVVSNDNYRQYVDESSDARIDGLTREWIERNRVKFSIIGGDELILDLRKHHQPWLKES
jgi:hypothetical protein